MNIGITAGDPAGIGLEVILRSLPKVLSRATWVIFSDTGDFEANLHRFAPTLPWSPLENWDRVRPGHLWLSSTGSGDPTRWGDGTLNSGRRGLAAVAAASRAALDGQLNGIVTAPISKQLVGEGFTGHTEYLRDRAGVQRVAMSFFCPSFKVVLATTHLPLREAIASLSTEAYCEIIELTDREFQRYGYPRPRIAISAVNPHAGEGGLLGNEDDHVLKPAVILCAEKGYRVSGPHPADSLYPRAHAGEFDVVLAPYHDQGLIPVKLIAHRSAANITLGLPYVRTSPDHGTAFAIAGEGTADTGGMLTAFEWALELAGRLVA